MDTSDLLRSELNMWVWHHCSQPFDVEVVEVHLVNPEQKKPAVMEKKLFLVGFLLQTFPDFARIFTKMRLDEELVTLLHFTFID